MECFPAVLMMLDGAQDHLPPEVIREWEAAVQMYTQSRTAVPPPAATSLPTAASPRSTRLPLEDFLAWGAALDRMNADLALPSPATLEASSQAMPVGAWGDCLGSRELGARSAAYAQAYQAFEAHQWDAAAAQLEGVVASSPPERRHPSLLNSLAACLFRQEAWVPCREVTQRLLDEFPAYDVAHRRLARLHLVMGEVASCRRLVEAHRRRPSWREEVAALQAYEKYHCLYECRFFAHAQRELQTLLAVFPTSLFEAFQVQLLSLDHTPTAIRYAESKQAIYPFSPHLLYWRLHLLFCAASSLEEWEAVQQAFREGHARFRESRFEQAARRVSQAVEVVREVTRLLETAQWEAVCTRVAAESPAPSASDGVQQALLTARATAHLRLGRFYEALADAQAALSYAEAAGGRAALLLMLAESEAGLRRWRDALHHARQSIALDASPAAVAVLHRLQRACPPPKASAKPSPPNGATPPPPRPRATAETRRRAEASSAQEAARQRLGLPPEADVSLVRRTYKAQALQWHPDRWSSASPSDRQEAEATFKEIQRAYECLMHDMGLLTTGGAPLRWGTEANNKAIPHVSAHGVRQFLNVYKEKRDIDHCPFLWGEELEHQLVTVREDRVLLNLEAAETMERLQSRPDGGAAVWHPEYGSFMAESTPTEPYRLTRASLGSVEDNIRRRYELLDAEAPADTVGMTLVTFPLMGTGSFTTSHSTKSTHSRSLFVPDVCINRTHPRFANLTENIRLRRGRKVCIQVPLYIDTHTLEQTVDKRLNIDYHPLNKDIDCGVVGEKKRRTSRFGADSGSDSGADHTPTTTSVSQYPAAEALTHLFTPATMYYYGQYFTEQQRENVKRRHDACPCPVPSVSHPCIYMDCMAFGMGCSCLQITMQLANERQARHLYDQLAVLSPFFLALSSATPFQKGLLCDSDVRWLTIAASVDDRKREEVPRIIKSRYDSISVFISPETPNLDEFNDSQIEIHDPYYQLLMDEGVDARLAKHIAHLFIRDPLVMYEQMIDIDDTTHSEHFENIQSTNWQTMRFKPPPLGSSMGWRVEFRVMDIQPTPYENAAFAVFVPLLTSAIARYNAVFYTKMTTVDENMGRAHHINPCSETYIVRKDIFSTTFSSRPEETVQIGIDEIFNGSVGKFYGLIPLVRRYVAEEHLECPEIESYLRFLSLRASGKIPTAAQYLRNFVLHHPDYKHDSRLSQKIALDLVRHVHDLATGKVTDDAYLPASLLKERKRLRPQTPPSAA